MDEKNELADRLWALVAVHRAAPLSELMTVIRSLQTAFVAADAARSGASARISVRWRDFAFSVQLSDDDSFTCLCCKLFLSALDLLERQTAPIVDEDERSERDAMRLFLACATDADVCVIKEDDGGLIGGLSAVADELTPLQVHTQLVDEKIAFYYSWQVVAETLGASELVDGGSGDDESTTPRLADDSSPAAALAAFQDRANIRMSSRLLNQTPGAAAADERRKKKLKRRVRRNTTSRTSSVSPAALAAAVVSEEAAPAPPNKRRAAIDELLATEREFVADLFMLNAHFAQPLAADKSPGRRKVGKALFQNVGDLLALHAALLVRLRRAAQVAPPAVAAAFAAWLAACDVCEPHAQYAGGFQRATALIEAAKAQPAASLPPTPAPEEGAAAPTMPTTPLITAGGSVSAFTGRAASVSNNSLSLLPRESTLFDAKTLQGLGAYVRLCEASPLLRRETLESLLIRPIQRLMRFPLLLRALRDETPVSEPEFGKLCVVIERIEEIIESVNETKAQRESEDKLLELAKSVAGLDKHKPEGFLAKGVFFDVGDTQLQQPQQWLLFENVLLRCVAGKVVDALATARLWVSGEHPDALASVPGESLSLVARRALARNAGVLVFGEAAADAESADDKEPAAPLAISTVVDTFGEKITQMGRRLVVRARTPMDARQWLRTIESTSKRLVRRVAAERRAAFFAAVCDGDLAAVRRLLEKAPALWNATLDETGGSAMHALCDVAAPTDEQLAVARFFIRCNANVLQSDLNDSIPLRSALVRGNAELARLLMPLSADVLDARRFARRRLAAELETRDTLFFGASTLHLLVLGGDAFRRLLSATLLGNNAKALVAALDGDGRSPLSLAIVLRDARTVRLLLRARAPCHGADFVGCDCGDGELLSEERAAHVFASRPIDAVLAQVAGATSAPSDSAPSSVESSPAAAPAPAGPLEEGSAARFAELLHESELAHAISRAAHFLKGKPSDPSSPFANAIVSPRGSDSPGVRLKVASARQSAHTTRRTNAREDGDSPVRQLAAAKSSRTSAGTTPMPLAARPKPASSSTTPEVMAKSPQRRALAQSEQPSS